MTLSKKDDSSFPMHIRPIIVSFNYTAVSNLSQNHSNKSSVDSKIDVVGSNLTLSQRNTNFSTSPVLQDTNGHANSDTNKTTTAKTSSINVMNTTDKTVQLRGKNASISSITEVSTKPTISDTGLIKDSYSQNKIPKNNINNVAQSKTDSDQKSVTKDTYHRPRNKPNRLGAHMYTPNDLKAYLMKLGLPRHAASQIMFRHNGHQLSEISGTVRPDNCKACFKNEFKSILDEPNFCQGKVFLLIMISSTASKRSSRDAIRETWGLACNNPNTTIKCLFLFGKTNNASANAALAAESKRHHDIVQHDFHDTYANLTYKTMTAMKWAAEKCPDAAYVMKTDDDMFVNTELLPVLLQAAPSVRFMGGVCWGPSPPHRERNSKWYVSFQQYGRSSFPPMCSGTGYVMSGDVVPDILVQSKNIPFFYLEDVYVALCLKNIKVKPVLLQGFYHTLVDFVPCNYRNKVITSHELNDRDLRNIWTGAQQCDKEELTPEQLYITRPY